MVIVTLKDGTTYNIDTEDEYNARSVVDYKLRDRLDHRQISTTKLEDTVCDKKSKDYNSGSAYDGKELHCTTGWSYKWS